MILLLHEQPEAGIEPSMCGGPIEGTEGEVWVDAVLLMSLPVGCGGSHAPTLLSLDVHNK